MDKDKTKKEGEVTAMTFTPQHLAYPDTKPPAHEKQKKLTVCFVDVERGYVFCITGRQLRTLRALLDAGAKGITALDVSSWAYRLASYIYDLRHKHGLEIQTIEEPHDGGFHARYVLISKVNKA